MPKRLQRQIKSALNFSVQDAWQPSTRTAKPRVDSSLRLYLCKCHFGNALDSTRVTALKGAEQLQDQNLRQLWPPSSVVQVSLLEVVNLPCSESGNSTPMMSLASAWPAATGCTWIQF